MKTKAPPLGCGALLGREAAMGTDRFRDEFGHLPKVQKQNPPGLSRRASIRNNNQRNRRKLNDGSTKWLIAK